MKSMKGFTLIELLIVIIILGILAAYAVPKYMNIDKQARISVVNALNGSIASAAEMVHAIAVASGTTNGVAVNIGSSTVTTANGGYPDVNGINTALSDSSGFTFNGGVFTKNGATTPATCSVTYTAPANASATPGITASTAGC